MAIQSNADLITDQMMNLANQNNIQQLRVQEQQMALQLKNSQASQLLEEATAINRMRDKITL